MQNKQRICFMDEIRGFCILCMVIYHAGYDLLYMFSQTWILPFMQVTSYVQPFFAGMFIFISGIASRFSRSNVMRGAKLFFVAMIISYATLIFMPSSQILFGILNMLSVCMMFYGVAEKLIVKMNRIALIIVCAVLAVLTYNLQYGQIGIPGIDFLNFNLPTSLLDSQYLYPLGIVGPGFYSSDYFPLFPWIFIFIAGTVVGGYALDGKFPKFMYKSRIPALSFLGKHTLLIYILHQPIILVVLYVIFWIASLF